MGVLRWLPSNRDAYGIAMLFAMLAPSFWGRFGTASRELQGLCASTFDFWRFLAESMTSAHVHVSPNNREDVSPAALEKET